VSSDKKARLQALGLSAPDLPPLAGRSPQIERDYEQVRPKCASVLAGIDVHSGHIFG